MTLGNDKDERRPVIGNNVKIFTGATIYGGIRIGDNVTIGAGAVVSEDVPDSCTVKAAKGIIVSKR